MRPSSRGKPPTPKTAARNKKFLKAWNGKTDMIVMAKTFDLAGRKAVVNLASHLRRTGHPAIKRINERGIAGRDVTAGAAMAAKMRELVLSDKVEWANLYDKDGKLWGRMNPLTREKVPI